MTFAPKQFFLLALACLLLLISGAGCRGSAADGAGLKRFEFSRQTLGQPLRLVVYVSDAQAASVARETAFAKLAEVESRLDARDPASEVARLSESAGGPWTPVSQDLFAVLQQAVQFSDQSDGEFDVTTGAAIALWDQAAASGIPPTAEEIAATKALIGLRKVQVNSVNRTVRLLLPGMMLDLEPLDAGYAVDLTLFTLRRMGVRRAMIEMRTTGIAAAIGTPPGEPGWKLTLPFPDQKGKPTKVILANDGVAWTPDVKRPARVGPYEYAGLVYAQTALPKAPSARVMVLAPGAFLASGIRQGATILGPAAGPFVRVNGRARVSFARIDGPR